MFSSFCQKLEHALFRVLRGAPLAPHALGRFRVLRGAPLAPHDSGRALIAAPYRRSLLS